MVEMRSGEYSWTEVWATQTGQPEPSQITRISMFGCPPGDSTLTVTDVRRAFKDGTQTKIEISGGDASYTSFLLEDDPDKVKEAIRPYINPGFYREKTKTSLGAKIRWVLGV